MAQARPLSPRPKHGKRPLSAARIAQAISAFNPAVQSMAEFQALTTFAPRAIALEDIFHTVLLPNIPKQFVGDIRSKFRRIFGTTVTRLRIYNPSCYNPNKRSALITFVNAQQAASVVSGDYNWPVQMRQRQIHAVRAVDWYQPVIRVKPFVRLSKNLESTPPSTSAKIEPNAPFERLNYYCLHHIYSYLDPIDIARLSEASTPLFEFAAEHIYPKQTRINFSIVGSDALDARQELDQIKTLLRHFGQQATHATMNAFRLINPTVVHIRMVLQNCPQLVQIRLQNYKLSIANMKSLIGVPIVVTDIQWIFMNTTAPNPDRMVEAIKKSWTSQIRSLTIYGNIACGNMRFLSLLSGLEKLSLASCWCKQSHMKQVVGTNGATLKSLSLLQMAHQMTGLYDALHAIAPNLVHLKMQISDPRSMAFLYKLRHLKHLQIFVQPRINVVLELSLDGNNAIPNIIRNQAMHWNLYRLDQLDELDLVSCGADLVYAAGAVSTLRVLSIRQPNFSEYSALFAVLGGLPQLERLQVSKCPGWSMADTIRVLQRSRSLSEIDVHFCETQAVPSATLVAQLIECLRHRRTAGRTATVAHPKLRLRIVEEYTIDVADAVTCHLLNDNKHLLHLHLKKQADQSNADKEVGDDYIPPHAGFYHAFDDRGNLIG